jgi:hypothetical protein
MTFRRWLPEERLSHPLDLLLARDQNGPILRFLAAVAFLVMLWLAAAIIERPQPDAAYLEAALAGTSPIMTVFMRPVVVLLYALEQPQVWRHLILPLALLLLGLVAGANYLNDLFELKDFGTSFAYLLGALFGLSYPFLEVKDGQVTPASKKTALFKIGGPGYVKIHLGTAALFERIGGLPIIYRATHHAFVHGFERLREPVDLKDQIYPGEDARATERASMEILTRDGIVIKAVDLQVMFRLWSDQQERNAQNPYPFEDQAFRRIVYGKVIGQEGEIPWKETVLTLARQHVAGYLGRRPLKELIEQKEKVDLTQPISVGQSGRVTPNRRMQVAPAPSNTRRPLTLSFYDPAFAERLRRVGVELIWIGVGTLDTPDEVNRELIEAWAADYSARVKASQFNQEEERRRWQAKATVELIQQVCNWWTTASIRLDPTSFFKDIPLSASAPKAIEALNMYYLKLKELQQGLSANDLPLHTDTAIHCIGRLAGPHILGEDDCQI